MGYQRRWLRRNLSPTTTAPPPPPRLVVKTNHFRTGLFREDFSHPLDQDVVLQTFVSISSQYGVKVKQLLNI